MNPKDKLNIKPIPFRENSEKQKRKRISILMNPKDKLNIKPIPFSMKHVVQLNQL